MKNKPKQSFSLILALCFSLIYPSLGFAGVDLPWSTTYDCAEWTSSDGIYNVNCDGLRGHGTWTCGGGEEEQITFAANFSGGGGGRGQRHWMGDGKNNNSGGLYLALNSTQSELWIRWYMRYESGLTWNPLHENKILYFSVPAAAESYIAMYGSDGLLFRSHLGGGSYTCSNCGWNTIMGGSTSDGQWHCYELHIKMDTNGSNGIAQLWVDEVLRLDITNGDFNTAGGWKEFIIASNAAFPNNGRCMKQDFDDIAISNTGYIGPTYGVPPSPPKNPRLQ